MNDYCVHMQYVFDYRPGDVYACVADIGWITGHSYVVYGPLCNGATTVLFESIPTYPDPGTHIKSSGMSVLTNHVTCAYTCMYYAVSSTQYLKCEVYCLMSCLYTCTYIHCLYVASVCVCVFIYCCMYFKWCTD